MSNTKARKTIGGTQGKGRTSSKLNRKSSTSSTSKASKNESPSFQKMRIFDSVGRSTTSGMDFEEQVKLQMEQLKQQQRIAEEKREEDKEKQKQTLKEKLRLRSEMKKQKKLKSPQLSPGKLSKQPSSEVQRVKDIHLDDQKKTILPVASTKKKEAICTDDSIALFNDLEKFATESGTVVTPALTFAKLMENLYIIELSDLEKVRLLFHWITAQDLNSMKFSGQIQTDTPLEYFKEIKEGRKTYAALLVRLCGAAGLHSKLITGYLKGAGYYPDYKFGDENDPFRGSWNAVFLQGEWRLMDTNWGARHITEEGEKKTDSGQPEYKYEEHYFLTDPEYMINTHYPDQADWQLLSPPLTIEQFQKTPKLWPLFFKLKLELHSHKMGLITVDETGYAKVQLKASPFARSDAKLKGELRLRGKLGAPDVADIPQNLFHHTSSDIETFEVFLPAPGKYLLKLFANSNKYSEKNIYTNICLYQLDCAASGKTATACKVFPPFPIISLFYGPSVCNSQYIARPVSHTGPVVECNAKGEAKVVMTVTSDDSKIAFAHDLFDSTPTKNVLKRRVINSIDKTPGNLQITFYVRTPSKGNFALALYSNVDDTLSKSFLPFCYYLVTSTNQTETLSDFPRIPNDTVGPIFPKFQESTMRFRFCNPEKNTDWKTGSLCTDAEGECIIAFEHSNPITMMADLSYTGDSENLNSYANVQTTGLMTCIIVRTPSKKFGTSGFLLRIYAAESAQDQSIPSVYVGLVIPDKANLDPQPFPPSPVRAWGPSCLHYTAMGITWMSFENSSWAFKQKCIQTPFSNCGPHRSYDGGKDFEILIKFLEPVQLKSKLEYLAQEQSGSQDNFTLLAQADSRTAMIRARFQHTGYYTLVIYGSKINDSSGQLVPLSYILINVKSPSLCTNPFPTAFGIWALSARNLCYPLNLVLKRNKEVTIKAYIAKFKKPQGGADWIEEAYPSVMLVVDGNQPIQLLKNDNNLYEWRYVPGPAEKVVGILVKPDAESQSMTYALQYQVEG